MSRHRFATQPAVSIPTRWERVPGSEISNPGRSAVINADGSVTFTVNNSGDAGVDDGISLAFRGRDARGASLPLQNGNRVLTDQAIYGDLGFGVPTLPTLGAGLHVGIGLCFGAMSSTSDRRVVLAVISFESVPLGTVDRLAPTLVSSAGTASADIRGISTAGGGHHYAVRPTVLPYGDDGRHIANTRAFLGVDGMGATPTDAVPELVIACWREGASTGAESVTVFPWALFGVIDMTRVPG